MPPHPPSASCRSVIHVDELAARRRASRLARQPVVELERVVEPQEHAGTRDAMHPARASGSDHLVDVDAEVAHRTARDDDEQRRDRAPRPAREVVEVERCPGRESHQLRRHARHAVPRVDAEEREPDLGEHARFDEAALVEDHAQRAPHVPACVASTPSTRSATYASMVVLRSPGPSWYSAHVPSSRCVAEHVADRAVANVVVRDAEKAQQQHVLGGHRDVGLELAAPPARRVLMLEQPVDGGAQRIRLHAPPPSAHRRPPVRVDCHPAALLNSVSAAVRPLQHRRLDRRGPSGVGPCAGDHQVGEARSPARGGARPGRG